jgi:predicted GH43/DUF377 family glycosyl hydrolase
MFGIKKVKDELDQIRLSKRQFIANNPLVEIPEFDEITINTDIMRAMYDPRLVEYLDTTKLIEPDVNLYYYNAGFYENDSTTYRMFYRCGKNPKGYEDRVATCLLDRNFNILPETNKYVQLHSNWEETTKNSFKLKEMLPFKFKDGTHVEDPRAIRNGDNWFLFYTDGITMGVAKLDNECNTIYTHYLSISKDAINDESDGREKNWMPILFKDGYLHVLYCVNPMVLFKYKDVGTYLMLVKVVSFTESLLWRHGHVRGGCPPVSYDNDKLIWFFHSVKSAPTYVSQYSRVYGIGAYVTKNTYPYDVIKITKLPILLGWPSHAVSKLLLQDNVIFPCGAVKLDENTYVICMGVNDYRIGYITIKLSDLLWENISVVKYRFVNNPMF